MEKEVISQRQAIALMTSFIIGSSSFLGVGSKLDQDVWLVIGIAMIAALGMVTIYARILKLFPGRGLFEILHLLFGKILGKIMILSYIWYALFLGALVMRDVIEFLRTVALTSTPLCTIAFSIAIIIIWAVRAGLEVTSRFISMLIPFLIFISALTTVLSIPLIDLKGFRPILYEGINPVLKNAFGAFSFPFAETVLFLAVLDSLQKQASAYKVYYKSILIGGAVITLAITRSILIMGVELTQVQYFATYTAARLIRVGEFLQRIESTASLIFFVNAVLKTTVCLYAGTKGIVKLFNLSDYHKMAAAVGISMTIFSLVVYDSVMEMTQWTIEIYKYFALPYQIILPIIIWITAEIKTRMTKNKLQTSQNTTA